MAEYELSEVAAINTNKATGALSKYFLWVEPPPAPLSSALRID